MKLEIQIPELYPKQLEMCRSMFTYTLYGGARGGGKSFVVRYKAIMLCLQYPGINILIIRRTTPELEENHGKPLRTILRCGLENEIAHYKEKTNTFTFPNGSTIKLGHCQHEKDIDKYQGNQFQVIFMDEGTHFTENMYTKLTECLRLDSVKMMNDIDYKKKWANFKCRMFITANPGGVGHAFIKRLFIDKQYREGENAEDYLYIPALVYDNKFIMEHDPNYVKKLEALPEKERLAMLYGDWNVFEGQFFEEFDEAVHTYEKTLNQDEDGIDDKVFIKPHWRRYRSRDYGLDMTAVLWACMDEDGTIYVDKEFGKSGLTVGACGQIINEMTLKNEEPFLDIVPPDLWNRQSQTGKSAVDIWFRDYKQYPIKANNDRVVGWLLVKEMLQINPVTGKPRLMINKNCTELIRCIKLIQHDEKNVNDCAKEPHDITHFPDALRYLCTSYTMAPDPLQVARREMPFDFGRYATNSGEYEVYDNDVVDTEEAYVDISYGGWMS